MNKQAKLPVSRSKYANNYKHGHAAEGTLSPTYYSWQAMKNRCLNPNTAAAKYYSQRGIMVCEHWLKFENFLADMGERPADKTLERKNNTLGYTPDNCVWATAEEQNRNRRGTKFNTVDVERTFDLRRAGLTQQAIATYLGVSQSHISLILSGKMWVES